MLVSGVSNIWEGAHLTRLRISTENEWKSVIEIAKIQACLGVWMNHYHQCINHGYNFLGVTIQLASARVRIPTQAVWLQGLLF